MLTVAPKSLYCRRHILPCMNYDEKQRKKYFSLKKVTVFILYDNIISKAKIKLQVMLSKIASINKMNGQGLC